LHFSDPTGITLDSVNERLLVADAGFRVLGRVWTVNLNSGARTVLSDWAHGSGPDIYDPTGITLDAANNVVLVVEGAQGLVLAIEGVTGERAILSK
jgi:DNA-binding beta-propeller fold protein YncE